MPNTLSDTTPQQKISILEKLGLFGQFILLSLAVFIVMGYLIISSVRPAIRSFIALQQERDTVVFVNRQANRQLTKDDFWWPSKDESQQRLRNFANDLQVPARFRVKIYNADSVVVYSDLPELIGRTFVDQELREVISERKAITEFKTAEETAGDEENDSEKDVKDFFEMYVPVTLGADAAVVAVINTYSRTGFINKSATEVTSAIANRIIMALGVLYAALAGIVWRASRTIVRQRDALRDYARTLVDRVAERTQQIEEVTKKQLVLHSTEFAG